MAHDLPEEQLRPRLIVSAVLGVPVVVLSMVMVFAVLKYATIAER